MCKVSDSTGPNSGSDCEGESASSGEHTETFARIKLANRKVKLIDILRHYGLKIDKNHIRPMWSQNIKCPLPNHKGARERTPSFAYCFKSDYFHCLGCHQAGRAVEFISLYESKPRYLVAEQILAKYGDDRDVVDTYDEHDYQDKLSPVLFEGSKYFQELIQKHKDNPKKLEIIHKVIWWIDFYIMQISDISNKKISVKKLTYRLQRAKELING